MHKVEYYQLPDKKRKFPNHRRWRWKLLWNKTVLARGEGHYATRSHARRAFKDLHRGVRNYPKGYF